MMLLLDLIFLGWVIAMFFVFRGWLKGGSNG